MDALYYIPPRYVINLSLASFARTSGFFVMFSRSVDKQFAVSMFAYSIMSDRVSAVADCGPMTIVVSLKQVSRRPALRPAPSSMGQPRYCRFLVPRFKG
jgi:hypothetical protein